MRALHPNRLSILTRLLLTNALVILIGATAGTLLTRAMADRSTLTLTLIFAGAGVALSLALNYVVLRIALRPLNQLTGAVGRIREDTLQMGTANPGLAISPQRDPEIALLAAALDDMLERLAAHTATIEANREQLRALSAQVVAAQEEERKRIARELHDDTSQSLASLIISLERLDGVIPHDLTPAKHQIQAAHDLACKTLEDLRLLVSNLRPMLLDDLGLVPAIGWYARQKLEPLGIDTQFDAREDMPRMPPTVETALFRIAQEAINNVIRHADASCVQITLDCDCQNTPACQLRLAVWDDGVGFDPASVFANNRDRFGLFGIRERVTALRGEVEIDSAIGKGTQISVRLPLEGETHGQAHSCSAG